MLVEGFRKGMASNVVDSFLSPENFSRQAKIVVCCVEGDTREASEDY